MRLRVAAAIIAFAATYSCSQARSQRDLKPMPPQYNPDIPDRVPFIVLGQVVERSHAAGPPLRSEWTGGWTQLWTVRVKVEQVLKGDLHRDFINIFYFPDMDAGSFSTPPVIGDLYAGHSELFFLEPDLGKLRPICDGWRSCIIWVRTGSHFNTEIKPDLDLPELIVNVLLSRGDHTTDAQMLDAIYHPERRWGDWPVYHALERLAKTDKSPQVRAVAGQQARKLLPLLPSEQEEQSAHQ